MDNDPLLAPSMESQLHVHSSYLLNTASCGVCVFISNHCSMDHRLREVFEQLHYFVVEFSNISRDSLNCMLIAIRETNFESIVLIFSSQGRHNILYDCHHNKVPMEDILSHFMDLQRNMLFLFETIASQTSIEDTSERTQLKECNSPIHSICVHIATSSSILVGFTHILNEFKQNGVPFAVQHMLNQIQGDIVFSSVQCNHDYSFHGNEK